MTELLHRLHTALPERYVVERELGRGGTATVFLARDLQVGRLVALKLLRPEVAATLGPERFLREVRLAAELDHPHILGLSDSAEVDGCLFYTMPYVAGESLRVRLQREPQLPIEEAVRIAIEVADALGYAHGQGVVHRDIKPENILLEGTEAGGRALVADFGIAQALSVAGGERLTATGMAVGTPAYMSPEQASGSRVDPRSDLYSLGCVLFEMLGGEPPYTGPTGQAILAKRAREPIPHLRTLRAEVPASVEQAVTRALAKSPPDRFATADQFAAALGPGATVPTLRRPRSSGRRALALGAGLALVVAAATGGAALLRDRLRGTEAVAPADARRLLLAAFANNTRDPSLDPLGDIVADYLTRGLAETRLVEVIDARAAQAGDAYAHSRDFAGALALAHALQAGKVIWGSYVRRGDSLEFRAQLTDAANGNPIGAAVPAVGPARQQTEVVETLRQRVMATVAAQMDPLFSQFQIAGASQPTNYDAYREFLAGYEISPMRCDQPDVCMADKVTHYRRAYALDSNWTLPLVMAAAISGLSSIGKCARVDSIAALLRPRDDHLPSFDRYGLDWMVASCHGQRAKALEAARQAMLAAPRSDWLVLIYAGFARHNGRLREAIELTERLDRARILQSPGEWTPSLPSLAYWGNRVIPYHLLGEYQRELQVAQDGRRVFPENMECMIHEAYALVGLGRLAEVNALVERLSRMVQADRLSQVTELSGWLDLIGRDLRAHGYRKEAQAVFERGIRWIEDRPAAAQRDLRGDLYQLLYDADRWDEARQVLKQLSADTPDDIDLRAALGAVAARLGDLREVARIDRWLAAQKQPYLNGQNTFNRARLAAILGDRDRAVRLYSQAVDEGFGFDSGYGVHNDPDFESVRNYPPFEALPGRF